MKVDPTMSMKTQVKRLIVTIILQAIYLELPLNP